MLSNVDWGKFTIGAILKAGFFGGLAFLATVIFPPAAAALAVTYGIAGGVWALSLADSIYTGANDIAPSTGLGKLEYVIVNGIYDGLENVIGLVAETTYNMFHTKENKANKSEISVEKAGKPLQEELKVTETKTVEPVSEPTLVEKMAGYENSKTEKQNGDELTKTK